MVNEQTSRDTKIAQLKRTIQCQLDEELKRRGVKNKSQATFRHTPNIIEDDPCEPPCEPRRSPRIALPWYNRANSVMFVNQDAVYEMLALAMEQPKEWVLRNLQAQCNNHTEEPDLQDFCGGVTHPPTGETITHYKKLLKIPELKETWEEAMCTELGKILEGYGEEKGTNTVKFLTHDEIRAIPKDRTITYARIVVDYRKQKKDSNRVRITVGGNLLKSDEELTVRTADLTTTKMMWNSVISTEGARYMCTDINSFSLESPLERKNT